MLPFLLLRTGTHLASTWPLASITSLACGSARALASSDASSTSLARMRNSIEPELLMMRLIWAASACFSFFVVRRR